MFLYFKEKEAQYVVVETGMGGRCDATNIIIPEICVITNVTLDHTEYLGDTVEKIAEEKAGIIKKGVPLVFGEKKESVKEIFIKKADDFIDALNDIKYSIKSSAANYKNYVTIDEIEYEVPLFGTHQIENFLTAYSALRKIGIEKEIIQKGISKCRWEGRFEIVSNTPFIVIDGAHNEDAALRLKENVNLLFAKERVILITSVLKDKDANEIFEIFSQFADEVIFTSLIEYERGSSGFEIASKYGAKFIKNSVHEGAKESIEYAKKTGKSIVIAGSLYLAGKFKKEVF
jgi:dihydrofolate synthase / folylpolyglutamate synthase